MLNKYDNNLYRINSVLIIYGEKDFTKYYCFPYYCTIVTTYNFINITIFITSTRFNKKYMKSSEVTVMNDEMNHEISS